MGFSIRRRLLSNIFGTVVGAVFFFTNCLLANIAEANLWAERKKSRNNQLASLSLLNPESGIRNAGAIQKQISDILPAPEFQNPKGVPFRQSKLLPGRTGIIDPASNQRGIRAPFNGNSSASKARLNSIPLPSKDIIDGMSRPLFELSKRDGFRIRNSPVINSLPYSYGTIRKISTPAKKASKKIVIHIQDIHQNEEAQSNIAKIAEELFSRDDVGLVALEGAFGPMKLEQFRSYPDQDTIHRVVQYLQKENRITGPVVSALTTPQRIIPSFVGIDDPVRYHANVEAYRNSRSQKDSVKKQINKERICLRDKKRSAFSQELLTFDSQVEAHREDALTMADYLRTLFRYSPSILSEADLFLQAVDLESGLDFAKVEKERTDLLEKLTQTLTESQLSDLLMWGMAYRTGTLSHTEFYSYLKGLCEKYGVHLSRLPEMNAYLQYLLLSDRIDSEKLALEMKTMEEKAYDQLIQTEQERELVKASRRYYLVGKLLDFALTPQEWGEYKQVRSAVIPAKAGIQEEPNHPPTKSFQTCIPASAGMTTSLDWFERFYKEAEARDAAMSRNLLRLMDEQKTSAAVLVTGGFHSPGIEKRLTEAGLTVVTFSPKVTKVEADGESKYLSYFAREKTPLEKLFEGTKLFVSPPPMPRADEMGLLGASQKAGPKGDPTQFQTALSQLAPRFAAYTQFSVKKTGDVLRIVFRSMVMKVRFNRDGVIHSVSYGAAFTAGLTSWLTGLNRRGSLAVTGLLLYSHWFTGLLALPIVLAASHQTEFFAPVFNSPSWTVVVGVFALLPLLGSGLGMAQNGPGAVPANGGKVGWPEVYHLAQAVPGAVRFEGNLPGDSVTVTIEREKEVGEELVEVVVNHGIATRPQQVLEAMLREIPSDHADLISLRQGVRFLADRFHKDSVSMETLLAEARDIHASLPTPVRTYIDNMAQRILRKGAITSRQNVTSDQLGQLKYALAFARIHGVGARANEALRLFEGTGVPPDQVHAHVIHAREALAMASYPGEQDDRSQGSKSDQFGPSSSPAQDRIELSEPPSAYSQLTEETRDFISGILSGLAFWSSSEFPNRNSIAREVLSGLVLGVIVMGQAMDRLGEIGIEFPIIDQTVRKVHRFVQDHFKGAKENRFSEFVKMKAKEGKAVIRISRPHKLNAANPRVIREIIAAIRQAKDQGAELIVLTGDGKMFMAGADLSVSLEIKDEKEKLDWLELGQEFTNTVAANNVVVALNGGAYGGGFEAALAAKLRIAVEDAKVGLTEANLGLIPGWGGTQRLPRLAKRVWDAIRMIVNAEVIIADDAHELGVIDIVVNDQGELDQWIEELTPDSFERLLANYPRKTEGQYVEEANEVLRYEEIQALRRRELSPTAQTQLRDDQNQVDEVAHQHFITNSVLDAIETGLNGIEAGLAAERQRNSAITIHHVTQGRLRDFADKKPLPAFTWLPAEPKTVAQRFASYIEVARLAEQADGDSYFVKPTFVDEDARIRPGDAAIVVNFRGDRAEPVTRILNDDPDFKHFPLDPLGLAILPFGVYNDEYFDARHLSGLLRDETYLNTLGNVWDDNGLKQLRIAESEKFKHVTFFWDGLRELAKKLKGLVSKLIPSNQLDRHDEKPEMKASEITDAAIPHITGEGDERVYVAVINYANSDIIGHFDNFDATVRAVQAVDEEIGRLWEAVQKAGGVLIITADHGSSEEMAKLDREGRLIRRNGRIVWNKAHAFDNPVDFIVLGAGQMELTPSGSLKNVAPTILQLQGLPKPAEMTAESLLVHYQGGPVKGPVVIAIRDGQGVNKFRDPEKYPEAFVYDAVHQARLRARQEGRPFHVDEILKNTPHGRTELWAHGERVGHPPTQMGDSETGHSNLGAGRAIRTPLSRMNAILEDSDFAKREDVRNVLDQARKNGGRVHLLGMISPGGVHSHTDHFLKLLTILSKEPGINEVILQPWFDGRDTDVPGAESLGLILQHALWLGEEFAEKIRIGVIAGRYYPMDRDGLNRDKKNDASAGDLWRERTLPWYEAAVRGQGRRGWNLVANKDSIVSPPSTSPVPERFKDGDLINWNEWEPSPNALTISDHPDRIRLKANHTVLAELIDSFEGLYALSGGGWPTEQAEPTSWSKWAEPIRQLLWRRAAFWDLNFSQDGHLFRAMRRGLYNGLLSGTFEDFDDGGIANGWQQKYGCYLVSEDIKDAVKIAKFGNVIDDNAIVVFPSRRFFDDMNNGQAAIMNHHGPAGTLLDIKWPFITRPLTVQEAVLIIVSPETKSYLDSILQDEESSGEDAEMRAKLLEYVRDGIYQKIVTVPLNSLMWQEREALQWAIQRLLDDRKIRPAGTVRANIYPDWTDKEDKDRGAPPGSPHGILSLLLKSEKPLNLDDLASELAKQAGRRKSYAPYTMQTDINRLLRAGLIQETRDGYEPVAALKGLAASATKSDKEKLEQILSIIEGLRIKPKVADVDKAKERIDRLLAKPALSWEELERFINIKFKFVKETKTPLIVSLTRFERDHRSAEQRETNGPVDIFHRTDTSPVDRDYRFDRVSISVYHDPRFDEQPTTQDVVRAVLAMEGKELVRTEGKKFPSPERVLTAFKELAAELGLSGPETKNPHRTGPKKRKTPITTEQLEVFLTDWSRSIRYEDLPPEPVNAAKDFILNAQANSVRGFLYNLGRITRDMALKWALTDGRGATIFGLPLKTIPLYAVLYLGALARDLDWDSTYLGQEPSHPDDNQAVLLAVAEAEGKSGKDVLLASVIAQETQVRFADALKLRGNGIDHVSYLALSATLGLARLKGLTREQTIEAFRIATQESYFLRGMRQKGLNTLKSWHAALAQAQALIAVEAAERGANGPNDAFNTKFGFNQQLLKGLDLRDYLRDFPTKENGLPFAISAEAFPKGYQAEYHAQSAVEASIELHKRLRKAFVDITSREEGLSEETLKHIKGATLHTFEAVLTIILDKDRTKSPANRETADHDMSYMIAHAIIYGYHDESAFTSIHRNDPRVQKLRQMFRFVENPEATARYYDPDPKRKWNYNRIVLEFKNRDSMEEERTNAFGHSTNPWPHDDKPVDAARVEALAAEFADGKMGWLQKASFQLINVYGAERTADLINRAMAFDQIPAGKIGEFMQAWAIQPEGLKDLTVEDDPSGSVPAALTPGTLASLRGNASREIALQSPAFLLPLAAALTSWQTGTGGTTTMSLLLAAAFIGVLVTGVVLARRAVRTSPILRSVFALLLRGNDDNSVRIQKIGEALIRSASDLVKRQITGTSIGEVMGPVLNRHVGQTFDKKSFENLVLGQPDVAEITDYVRQRIRESLKQNSIKLEDAQLMAQYLTRWLGQPVQVPDYKSMVIVAREGDVEAVKRLISSANHNSDIHLIVDARDVEYVEPLVTQLAWWNIHLISREGLMDYERGLLKQDVFEPSLWEAINAGTLQNTLLSFSQDLAFDKTEFKLIPAAWLTQIHFTSLEDLWGLPIIRVFPLGTLLDLARAISINA